MDYFDNRLREFISPVLKSETISVFDSDTIRTTKPERCCGIILFTFVGTSASFDAAMGCGLPEYRDLLAKYFNIERNNTYSIGGIQMKGLHIAKTSSSFGSVGAVTQDMYDMDSLFSLLWFVLGIHSMPFASEFSKRGLNNGANRLIMPFFQRLPNDDINIANANKYSEAIYNS